MSRADLRMLMTVYHCSPIQVRMPGSVRPMRAAAVAPQYRDRWGELRLTLISGQVVGWSGCQHELASFML